MMEEQNETLWQRDSSTVWITDAIPECCKCGKKCQSVIEIQNPDTGLGERYCWAPEGDTCYMRALELTFVRNPKADFINMRLIEYFQPIPSKVKRPREPVGLAKRYAVLRRDGFQCVLCGASGALAKIEVDHEIPVASGGANEMSNLRTLCFNCNRGKGDKSE